MSLENVISRIPFLAGYEASRQQREQEQSRQLQQAGSLMQLLQAVEQQKQAQVKAQQQEAYRRAIGALPPDATEDQMLQAARPFQGPDQIGQQITASRDRKAKAKADEEMKHAQLMQTKQQADMMHEFRMSQLRGDAERRAETERHNKVNEQIQAQLAASNAALRGMGISIQQQGLEVKRQGLQIQQDRNVQEQTQQLGTALERANLPESDAVLRGVEEAMQKTSNLHEYLAGPKSLLPDLAVPKDVREGRQAFQKLFNITLKNRSGAAVTNPEFERLKNEFATGAWKTPDQVKAGVQQARNIVSQHYRGVAAGFGPDTVERYNNNLRSSGGTPLLEKKEDPLGIR